MFPGFFFGGTARRGGLRGCLIKKKGVTPDQHPARRLGGFPSGAERPLLASSTRLWHPYHWRRLSLWFGPKKTACTDKVREKDLSNRVVRRAPHPSPGNRSVHTTNSASKAARRDSPLRNPLPGISAHLARWNRARRSKTGACGPDPHRENPPPTSPTHTKVAILLATLLD